MVGQQGLVGGDHVLAPGDGAHHIVPGGIGAADEFHHDIDFRVVQDVFGPGGEDIRRQGHGPRPVQVQVRHLLQDQGRPQAPGQQLPLLGEQAHHAGPHGAEADQADLNGFHVPLKILAPNTGAKVFTPVFRAQFVRFILPA